MKIIKTIEEFHAHLQAQGGTYRDLRTRGRIPLEVIEQKLLSGTPLHVPETAEEVDHIFAANVREIGRTDGWIAAAKMVIEHDEQDWNLYSRKQRRSLATFLRRKFD